MHFKFCAQIDYVVLLFSDEKFTNLLPNLTVKELRRSVSTVTGEKSRRSGTLCKLLVPVQEDGWAGRACCGR